MRKKTRINVVIASIFLIALVALAPYLFHKSKPAETNTIIASDQKPVKIPSVEIIQPHLTNPVSNNKPIKKRPIPVTKPKPVMKNTNPTPDLLIREEERPIPIEKESPEVITGDKTEITDNNQTIRNTTPDIPKQGQKADSGSQGNSGSNEQPSPWSITIMATNSGVDAGISYRLLQLALLKETDLDLVIGIKQAGIGLSKYVSGNFGLGLIGTVAYGNGDKNLGIYGKYSF